MPKIDRSMVKSFKQGRDRPQFNIRLPVDLLGWAKEYAHRNDTTVSQILIDHLKYLRQNDVPQV